MFRRQDKRKKEPRVLELVVRWSAGVRPTKVLLAEEGV